MDQVTNAVTTSDLFRQSAFIDGRWIQSATTIEVDNPATGQTIGAVPNLGPAEAEAAVEAAHRAMPEWKVMGARTRSQILRRWFELIRGHDEDLARILTLEQGKPLAEAKGEIAYAAAFIEWFAEEARRVYGEVIPGHVADKRLTVLREPLGVVAAVTPWNFPAAMITRKAAPALAVGCTMVLKPSELTPFTALALAALAERAGIPPGVFNVVTGNSKPIGEVLTTDPRIRKFTFTGSTAVGKMLAARCMQTVKRVSLELGGNAPLLVFDDADLDAAIEGAVQSKFRNTGQTCVCANRLLIQSGIYDAFAAKLVERVARFKLGPGLEGPTEQGPLINEASLQKVERHVADAQHKGAKVLCGGSRIAGPGTFYAPTVITDARPDMLFFREETFGPLAALVRFEDEAEAISMANDTTAGLAAYVFTQDLSRSVRVSETLQYGMVGLNTGAISTEVAPFGGVKESGFGREGSRHGLDDYLELKLVCTQI